MWTRNVINVVLCRKSYECSFGLPGLHTGTQDSHTYILQVSLHKTYKISLFKLDN